MTWDAALMLAYQAMALVVAAMMVWTMLTGADWRTQLYAAFVFVPFALRALGVK